MSAPPFAAPAEGPGAPPWRLARFLHATAGKLMLAAYRTRFEGSEHLPTHGGYILAGNHASYLDPVLLWCGQKRPIHFLAKQELFDNPVIGWMARRLWAFPIQRGSADREAIQRATDLLKRGELVGIFPEGTRHRPGDPGALGEASAGVAFIAMHANVPVVPVGISGTEKALPRGAIISRFPKVTVCYGTPLCPDEFTEGGRKERTQAMTAEIMRRIAEARTAAEKE